VPAQDDLGGRPAVGTGDLGDDRLLQQLALDCARFTLRTSPVRASRQVLSMPVPKTPAALTRNMSRLHDHAYSEIAAKILDGTFPPGSALDDSILTGMLGISRSPIRQALSMLADRGLVDMEPNRWTRVAYPNPALFLDGVRILSTLWALGAETALPRLTELDVANFDTRLETVLELGLENDPEQAAALIAAVHDLFGFFLTYSGNPLLATTVDRVQAQVAHTARAGAGQFDLPSLSLLLEQLQAGVHTRDQDQVEIALTTLRDLAGKLLERMDGSRTTP
jgi:DNA-binding GntR family transcriptional regulator